jgi:hypothetical protein
LDEPQLERLQESATRERSRAPSPPPLRIGGAADDEEMPATPTWPVTAVLATGLALFSVGLLTTPGAGATRALVVALVDALLVGGWIAARRLHQTWWPPLRRRLEAYTDALDALPEARIGLWIGLASGAGLFAELLIIRWQASAFQLFAYFKNVSLLAAFLGLGIGYARGRQRPVLAPLVLPALVLQVVVMHLLRYTEVQGQLQNPVSEQLSLGMESVATLGQAALTYGFLLMAFGLTVLTCVPLGHLASRLMLRRPPLVAYTWNLVGSLVGIAAFTLVSAAWSPPAVWLIVLAAALLPLLLRPRTGVAAWSLAALALALAVLALPLRTDLLDIYSPYQILSLRVERRGAPVLQVNHTFYQHILDLSEAARARDPALARYSDYYDLPYRFKDKPGRVLVVGAGSGNDVAAGLRHGAGRIDAVEIDPAIQNFGRLLHPEAPYDSPRVQPIVDDARGFMRRTARRYDLIVYGLLDSHTLLSGVSSVRLDSFVYTVDGFRDARARLTDDGLIALTFALMSQELGRKIFLMLTEAFDGTPPRVFFTRYAGGFMFLAGPGVRTAPPVGDLPFDEVTAHFANPAIVADVSTDDWPFFYMPVRRYPVSYLVVIAVLLVASGLILRQLMPIARGSFSAVCFFLGAGFMLVETRGITELALTFGNTWQVVSAVIAGILIMGFFANLLIMRLGAPPPAVVYGLLMAALVLGLGISGATLAGLPPAVGRVLATALVTLPLFFSGFAFSSEVARSGDLPAALSSNLLGAMLGGFLEYNAMYFGFRSLYGLALVVYGLAFVAAVRFPGPRLTPAVGRA